MDIALHPNFGQTVLPGEDEVNYVYAFYIVDPPETAENPPGTNVGPEGGGNRFAYLVRFTADAATNYTTAVPSSEVVLLGGAVVTLRRHQRWRERSTAPATSPCPSPASTP